MRTFIRFAAAVLVAAGLTATAHAADVQHGALTIEGAWARPSIGTKGNSAAYFTIRNTGAADRLVSVSTAQAGRVELHIHKRDGDIMRMREVEGGIPVPAHGDVALKPGGYHVMLMRLTAPIKKDSTLPLTLTFEKAGTVTVHAAVSMKPAMKGHGHKGMKGHGHK